MMSRVFSIVSRIPSSPIAIKLRSFGDRPVFPHASRSYYVHWPSRISPKTSFVSGRLRFFMGGFVVAHFFGPRGLSVLLYDSLCPDFFIGLGIRGSTPYNI